MKVLYWNVHRKPIQHLAAALAHEYDLDIIILSESVPKVIKALLLQLHSLN